MILGFTGTSERVTDPQRKALRLMVRKGLFHEVHHGDCVNGDAEFDAACRVARVPLIVEHPPLNPKKRAHCSQFRQTPGTTVIKLPEKEYLERNQDIVDASEALLAIPQTMREELRSGEWATIRRARKKGIPITLIWPDGSVTTEPARTQQLEAPV